MAQPHLQSGQIAHLAPLGAQLSQHVSTALFKASQLEVVRLVLPRGQSLREHRVPGEITLQCLEGEVRLQTDTGTELLRAGDLVHMDGNAPHGLQAVHDSSLLLTICLAPRANPA